MKSPKILTLANLSYDCIDHGFSGNKPGGYHQLRVSGRLQYVHRLAYAERHNICIEDAPALIRHTCHNPRCVNTQHLVPGTHQDNANDRVAAGRNGKTRKRKLTTAQQEEVLLRFKKNCRVNGGEALARHFGVSCHPIHDLVKGK